MKVLVSYMFRANSREIVHGHTDLEMSYWDTKAVTEKLGEIQGVAPTSIILTSVFHIPAMPKETSEMYALRSTLENRLIVLALTKAEAAVVLTALQSDCGYAESEEEIEIYDHLMETLENALVPA